MAYSLSPGSPQPSGFHGSPRARQFGDRGGRVNHHYRKPELVDDFEWRTWPELEVKIVGLSIKDTVVDIYRLLKSQGNIARIKANDGYEDGKRHRFFYVLFRPPPTSPFWNQATIGTTSNAKPIKAELLALKIYSVPSPKTPSLNYPEVMTLNANNVDFCFMTLPEQMMIMRSVTKVRGNKVSLSVNVAQKELVIAFSMDVEILEETVDGKKVTRSNSPASGDETSSSMSISHVVKASGKGEWKLVLPFQQLDQLWVREHDQANTEVIIPMKAPPVFFRKVGNPVSTMSDDETYWVERKAWLRQTDIYKEPDGIKLRTTPLNAHKTNPHIDLGAWTTYRVVFPKHVFGGPEGTQLLQALLDFNVQMFRNDNLTVQLGSDLEPPVWDSLDGPRSKDSDAGALAKSAYDDMMAGTVHLAWSVRYQLEVCMSQGILNPYNINRDFLERLQTLPEREALRRLEHVADKGDRLYDPFAMLTLQLPRATRTKVPPYCTLQRSATITPSHVYYSTPTVEVSNRIIRQYKEHADRFLRVRFSDEKAEGKLHNRDDETNDALFNRVRRCLFSGITIGHRHFEYLASGNSQFKEHGAYFFSPTADLSANTIREWMGDFRHLQVVAKYSSRMGQCYSTTRAITGARVHLKELDDVTHNGYTFTDGVGKISPFLARIIALEFKLDGEPPSAFQFRLGGCKGVLVVSPDAKGHEVHIRRSQYKFAAHHEGLEIVRYSDLLWAQLNRQLITNLACLGVSDEIFVGKMHIELQGIENVMKDERLAVSELQTRVDPNQTTLTIASITMDGFVRNKDPFAMSVLHLWRAWRHKTLKEKANIVIKDGAFVIGVTDETQTLRGHYNTSDVTEYDSYEDRVRTLPQIFLQLSDKANPGNSRIVEEVCVLMRNPSLHPGDVRIVKAVDVPALHHLKDVVVFPQTGDRDIPLMCSGGDLDGDDYFVAWDKTLIPPEWNHEPMIHHSATPKEVKSVSIADVIDFHVSFMKQDSLGRIANAWLALADQAVGGPKHESCVRLAQEHSTAVDFGKSGQPASGKLIHELGLKRWPHFLERKNGRYHSKTACGRLYDMVDNIPFTPMLGNHFDRRVLQYYEHIPAEMLAAAIAIKTDYDSAMRRIMNQWEIKTEFEIWTAFVMQHSKLVKAYEIQTEIGRLSEALKLQYREECIKEAGGESFDKLGPFVAAMYKVTADETAKELRDFAAANNNAEMSPEQTPLISFPWLFHRELGKIARRGKSLVQFGQHNPPVVATAAPRHLRHIAPTVHKAVETATGTAESGDLLVLFDDDTNSSSDRTVVQKQAQRISRCDLDELVNSDDFVDAQESPEREYDDFQRPGSNGNDQVSLPGSVEVYKSKNIPDILGGNPRSVALPKTLEKQPNSPRPDFDKVAEKNTQQNQLQERHHQHSSQPSSLAHHIDPSRGHSSNQQSGRHVSIKRSDDSDDSESDSSEGQYESEEDDASTSDDEDASIDKRKKKRNHSSAGPRRSGALDRLAALHIGNDEGLGISNDVGATSTNGATTTSGNIRTNANPNDTGSGTHPSSTETYESQSDLSD